jgi:flagellar biosynthetic protein FliQ
MLVGLVISLFQSMTQLQEQTLSFVPKIVSAPIMGIGMLVGLVISLFQSMTQLQEQTLSFVPKIVAMVGVAIVLIPWLADRLIAYAQEMLGESPF